MSSKTKYAILLLLFMAVMLPAHAQFYNGMNMSFGKNRVQWGDFHWSYYKNDNFDVYFYQGGDDLARYAQAYAKARNVLSAGIFCCENLSRDPTLSEAGAYDDACISVALRL